MQKALRHLKTVVSFKPRLAPPVLFERMKFTDVETAARSQNSIRLFENETDMLDVFEDQAARDEIGVEIIERPRHTDVRNPKLDIPITNFSPCNRLHLFREIH